MSTSDQTQDELTEKQNRIVMGNQEIEAINGFMKHFNLDYPPGFKEVLDAFLLPEGKTLRNQKLITVHLCNMVVTSKDGVLKDIPVFQDKTFDVVKESCAKRYYDLQFDFDVENALTAKQDK